MGMFDNIIVKKPLPLTEELKSLNIKWEEEVFQTKDLDNLLDLYEITSEGKLKHLIQNREWKESTDSTQRPHLEVVSESWVEEPFHGIIRFYTSHCDNETQEEEVPTDISTNSEEMSWHEIFQLKGNDWWIEFLAIFDEGNLRELRVERVEKTPISARLASQKEWKLKREFENRKLLNRVVKRLRKIPGYSNLTRNLSKFEYKLHETLSKTLRKIS
jgi:hypothetical protein